MRPKASHMQQKAASAEINTKKSKSHQVQKKASPVVTEKLPGARNAAGKKRQLPETMGDSDDQSDTSDAAWIAPTNEDSDDDDNESRQEDLEIDYTRENVEEAEESENEEESEEEDEGDIPLEEEKESELESGGLDHAKEDHVGKPNTEKIEDPMSALMAQRIAEKRKARQVSSSRSSVVASISQKQPINIVGEI